MNWDKPLKRDKVSDWQRTLDYHGLRLENESDSKSWTNFCDAMKVDENDTWQTFYPKYLNYCKLMSSPLGQALL
jgi:hypothetical protein